MAANLKTIAGRNKPILYFLLSFIAALVLTLLLKEPSFTTTQLYVLFLLFFAMGLWFTEAVPPFAVSIFIIAYLVFMLGNKNLNASPENIEKYVTTFSSSVIWLMLGGFFLASAMTKTKLDEALFKFTLKISGTNPRNLLIGLMSTTMIASMLMSNTASTAMVITSIMPLLNSLGNKSGLAKALLLGVPVAATTGGMGTIIGSPPNLIATGALENIGINVSFLDWMIYGLPVSLVLTAISCFVLIRIFIKDKKPISLDFLQNRQTERSKEENKQRLIVLIILSVTILLWLTTSLHGIKVGAVSAVPLVFLTLTGVLKSKDVQGLPWDTLLLVAGGLSLGMALQSSGLLEHYAQKMRNLEVHYIILFFILAYMTMVFSNVMSHTATSTVLIPLGIAILTGFETQIAIIIGLAASSALFLPVSSPPNAIAYSTGFLKISDFRIGGIVVGLLGPLLAVLWMLLMVR
ncbi:SLC13 family permease [Flavihumibacter profundi]|jgi:solute carrier family 13 (sodium-dependent dicarboxylate transporter), member 2/3/5|uniref:SLC13 family permease n=1 Tax=Flavihumibacter profundi TaxID=2716883 RepID=UPI001CC4EBAA|nr:DASS family sodium-coupled anion symporter [Flavihumibacter profundi]MBZ5859369.1 DASS family sodium-coupled anion symporter [Flavihumibacter profundi]